MDRSFRSQNPSTPNRSVGFRSGKTKAGAEPVGRNAEKTATTSWGTNVASESRYRRSERGVRPLGANAAYIVVIAMALWLVLTDDVGTAPTELPTPWRVDIQHASKSELMILPGIGPALADRILEFRAVQPLQAAEDLSQIHGIGPVTVEEVRRLVVFEEDLR